MATDAVAICNSALAKLGSLRITALADSTEHARLCNEQYNKIRKDLLRSHPFNFAIKRIALVATTDPVFGFASAFTLPSDNLRVLELDGCAEDEWAIEGSNTLVCDLDEANIKYIYDLTDTTKFTSDFDELLALTLAHDICYALVQSVTLKDMLEKQVMRKTALVRTFDAQEGTGQRVTARRFLNARRSRGT